MDFRREYLVQLPLPLAQLYSRAFNAKDSRARHDNAFYLFEATVKLSAAPAIACYLQELQQGAARDTKLDRMLLTLALPSFGQWVAMLRALSRHFGERADAVSHPLGPRWKQLTDKRTDLGGLLALFRRIKQGPDGAAATDEACSVLDLFESLVQYRNAVFGHGGPRTTAFFDREMGPLLLPAANDLLAAGTFDLLGPRGSRLLYLTDVRIIDDAHVDVGSRDLIGRDSERVAPLTIPRDEARQIVPNRVALLWPGQSVPWRLDPLLIYRESETAEEVLFLNRDRKGRQVEYLSYSSGRTERDRTGVPEMCRMLSMLAERDIGEADLEKLTEQSIAETPSVDVLAPAPLIGRQQGDYEILAEIGRGGMGVVYLARQLSLGRVVALKMLPADVSSDEVALARFRREIQHLARCEHPNIVKVLGSGTMPDGRLYYAMEYVPGCDLEQVWKELGGGESGLAASSLGQSTWAKAVLTASRRRRDKAARDPADGFDAQQQGLLLPPLPELPSVDDDPGGYVRRVCELIRDAALALQVIHDQKLIHRDIKPANLMLTPDGRRIVLMDFGLIKAEGHALTTSGSAGLLGTLRYAAPEQLAAATAKVGPRADIYGLGCVMWELLTGRRMFGVCRDEASLAAAVLHSEIPQLRSIDSRFDRDLETIVARSIERDADDRFASGSELAEHLQRYLDGKPIGGRGKQTARKTDVDGLAANRSSSIRVPRFALFGLIALGGILLLGGIWWALRPASDATLFVRAQQLMDSGDKESNWPTAREKYLIPLLERSPNGPYAGQARESLDQIDVYLAERRAANTANTILKPASEAERIYNDAMRPYERLKDHVTTARRLRHAIELFKDRPEDKAYASLAKQKLAEIEAEGGQTDSVISLVIEKLARADDLAAAGNRREAQDTWKDIIAIYQGNQEFEEQVKYARLRLQGEPPGPAPAPAPPP